MARLDPQATDRAANLARADDPDSRLVVRLREEPQRSQRRNGDDRAAGGKQCTSRKT